jgi:nitroreductase
MLSLLGLTLGSSATVLFTLWLAAGALGLGIVAVLLSRPPEVPEDLDAIHRMIDLARDRVRRVEAESGDAAELRRQLRVLVARLPKGDARRYLG